jgi:hypothetical protein
VYTNNDEILAFFNGTADTKYLFQLNIHMGSRLNVHQRPDGYFYVLDVLERNQEEHTYAVFMVTEKLLRLYLTSHVPFRRLLSTMGSDCSPLPVVVKATNSDRKTYKMEEVPMSAFLLQESGAGEHVYQESEMDHFDLGPVKKWLAEHKQEVIAK